MNVLYSDQPAFTGGLSIFLAGPTPRTAKLTGWKKHAAKVLPWLNPKPAKSWRPEAIEILNRIGFTGTVLVPERRDWSAKFDYTDQTEWEYAGLSNSTVILFWVPREMTTMPALTTNVEFGYWLARTPEKIVYGRPDDAASVRYLDWLLNKEVSGTEPLQSLEDTLRAAAELAGVKRA